MKYGPFEVSKHLRVSKELAKINMEHVSFLLQHDVVIVTIADSQDIGGDTVASAGCRKIVYCLESETSRMQKHGRNSNIIHTRKHF